MSSLHPMHTADAAVPRQPSFALADGISLIRLPLAVAFVLIDHLGARIGLLALAAASDLGDGWVARRRGGSRVGVLLDPITDKIFMAAAFGIVLVSGALTWLEVIAVLLRDIVASVAFVITLIRGQSTSVPARLGGKIVTALQLVTILLCLIGSAFRVQVAWLTAGAALYAIYDYNRPFFRKLNTQ